ncbi:D-alanyl-D-alanine carboxypeptidase family protein [Mycoplasma sp. P36-A1]|uniref:D-alanyl-D-alanine carboxypeptidase family protein n=1 Tax=Mycoplasma sp. P36-A1 TaxID=3252900 RepID=UPI003C2D1FB8
MKKRKIIPIVILLLLISFTAFKYFMPNKVTEVNNNQNIEKDISFDYSTLKTSNKASLLMNLDTNQVIFNHNMQQSIPVYSVSKTMFLATVSKQLATVNKTLDTNVKVSKLIDDVNNHSNFSSAGLKSGQQFTIKELYEAVMMPSGNDASILLAEEIFGSQAAAVNAMNANAKEWKMTNSSFVSTSGLDGKYIKKVGLEAADGKNLMSPYDLVLLVKQIQKNYPEIIEAGNHLETTIGTSNNNPITLHNVNGIMDGNSSGIKNVFGLKTGSNIEEYSNAIVALKKDENNNTLLAISLASKSRVSLYSDIASMYSYANNLETVNMQDKIQINSKAGFTTNEVTFTLDKPYYLYLEKGQDFKFSIEELQHYNKHLNKFYVNKKGEEIGVMSINDTTQFFDNTPINNTKVVVANEVQNKGIFAKAIEFISDIYKK